MQIHHIIISPEDLSKIIQQAISDEFKKRHSIPSENKKPIIENPNCLIEEASKITGLAISTIRTKCHLGEMPYFKPPGTKKLQFNRDALLEWMVSGKNKTVAEMEKEIDAYLTNKRKK